MIYSDKHSLTRVYDGERMEISAFGPDSLRVRVTKLPRFDPENWALLEQDEILPEIQVTPAGDPNDAAPQVNSAIAVSGDSAVICNGRLRARITRGGKLIFENSDGKTLLTEYEYDRRSILGIPSRELRSLPGGGFAAGMLFYSDPNEKLYGMGQYQNGIFNLKGSFLELAQRNTQASVPFVVSSLGYGFLWNNPAVGRASFGTNMTQWQAQSTRQIDFWITAGDSPRQILENYMRVTGLPPQMPEHGLGFWQCKLRYQTQQELLQVAREYHRRGIALDVIIADFFHWTLEGTWAFDPAYWPDPLAMVQELKSMGTRLMVSVWPTVSLYAPDYKEMRDRGLLVRDEQGVKISKLMIDPTAFIDATNPQAQAYLWGKIKQNYVNYGITDFWLDVAEPEFTSYDFENYRYYKGSAAMVGNEYPAQYTKIFYDGLKGENEAPVNLVRCAWAGSQRYGALVWSGDIPSTFASLRTQVVCGLQMAMAGIPWWTTDIGGFHGGNINDPQFKELLVRWFQFGLFSPVMRLHGHRQPFLPPLSHTGGGRCGSGAENEIWSYGEENYAIMKACIETRERMRPYLRQTMQNTSTTGAPVLTPLFYYYPGDENAWEICDSYLFGRDILVAPILEYGCRRRSVYLPRGENWVEVSTGKSFPGGQQVECEAPLSQIPLFVREAAAPLLKVLKP